MNHFTHSHKQISSLVEYSSQLRHLVASLALLSWDQETYLPKGAGIARAKQQSTLAGIYHEKATAKNYGKMLEKASSLLASGEVDFTEHDRALVRELVRDYDKLTKLPQKLVKELSEHSSLGLEAWKKAREAANFSLFASELATMIELKQEVASRIGYSDSPYDVLLDEFEAGLTKKEVEGVFEYLIPSIQTLLPALLERTSTFDRQVFSSKFYDEDRLWDVTMDILHRIGFDLDRGRQDVSTHPFTMSLHPSDVRLTTRVIANNPLSTLMSTIHEAGHGMYEQGIPEELAATVLGAADSLVLHESQSRLWENMIGKSKVFWEYFFPVFVKEFPEELAIVGWEDAWKEVNVIRPSLIRVDADEVTYHFHIYIRFQIESQLVEGKLKVADVPEAWNSLYKQYLNIDVPDDSMGCLQDIHWSQGLMGYFPTYSMGSLLSVQLFDKLTDEHPSLPNEIKQGDFAQVRSWLTDAIHRHGRTYTSQHLANKATGKPIDPDHFVRYIKEKFEV